MPKDFRKFRKEIEQAGYVVKQTKSGHYSVEAKEGYFLEGFLCLMGSAQKEAKNGTFMSNWFFGQLRNIGRKIVSKSDLARHVRIGRR